MLKYDPQTARSLPSSAGQSLSKGCVLLFIASHPPAEKFQGLPAMLCCTTCLSEFQESVLAGGVTIWVDIDAKLDFSFIACQTFALVSLFVLVWFSYPLLVLVKWTC